MANRLTFSMVVVMMTMMVVGMMRMTVLMKTQLATFMMRREVETLERMDID